MIMDVFVFAQLHACLGKQSEVQQAMFEVQGPARPEPGCLSYGAFRSVRDPDEFYIHTRWKDMTAFERHAEWPSAPGQAARLARVVRRHKEPAAC
jgi:quinol monooxygenase YgiN